MRSGVIAEGVLWLLAAGLFVLGADFGARDIGAFEPSMRDANVMRLVTWNVGGAENGVPHSMKEEHVPAIADALARLDADLVFVQELVDGAQLRRLADALGRDWTAWRGRGDCGVLTRRSDVERWGPRRVRNHAGVLWPRDGRDLVVLALHADAFSAKERNEAIGESHAALMAQAGHAHVLLGDLNLDVDQDKKSELFSDDLHADVESYNVLAATLTDAALGKGPTAEPDRRLDYVFVSRELEIVAAGPWFGRRVGTMDHHPVVVDLRWR
ncbi:MAG: endonuclease/exonuclease/phosphatase family protein [Planctomycetes bacterium]|nr:endonuclease/exonuclease/phosphatase family protein [Planctomycetota bacterium]